MVKFCLIQIWCTFLLLLVSDWFQTGMKMLRIYLFTDHWIRSALIDCCVWCVSVSHRVVPLRLRGSGGGPQGEVVLSPVYGSHEEEGQPPQIDWVSPGSHVGFYLHCPHEKTDWGQKSVSCSNKLRLWRQHWIKHPLLRFSCHLSFHLTPDRWTPKTSIGHLQRSWVHIAVTYKYVFC